MAPGGPRRGGTPGRRWHALTSFPPLLPLCVTLPAAQFEPKGFLRKLGSHPCFDPVKVSPSCAVATHALAACAASVWALPARQRWLLNSSRLSLPSLTHTQDLVVPLMKDPDHWHLSPLAGAPTRNRTLLAFHRGRVRRRRPPPLVVTLPWPALLATV